jgi:outer membrane protein W
MSRRLVAVTLGAATLLIAATTSARQPSAPAGGRGAIQVGLRLGYGVPFGKTGSTATDLVDDDLSRSISGQIPIGIDAGYLITPHVYVGLLFQYGFGLVGSGGDAICNQTGVTCSTTDTTLGIGAHLHLDPTASFDPWIGLGVAYEWVDFSASLAGRSASSTGAGLQYVNVQLGGDISVAPNLAVGPFVSFSAGQYGSVSQDNGTTSTSQDITNKSFHEWLLFGVRGVYNIRL